MCKVIEEMRREERVETLKTAALRMLSDKSMALEKISEFLDLPLDEVKKLQAEQST